MLKEKKDAIPEGLDTKVFTEKYLPEAFPLDDPRRAEITLGQLLCGVDPKRRLIDPRVVDHIGKLAQLVETRTAQWSRHQGPKSRHD